MQYPIEQIFKKEYKEKIGKFISNYMLEKENEFSISSLTKEIYEKLIFFSLSGKLIRGSLVLFIYEQIKKEITEDIIAVAAALELIHSSFLIHDDIMDQDEIRRGKDTMYAQYTKEGMQKKFADAKQYGISAGICVGDLGYFLGFELLSQFTSKEIIAFCLKEFSKVTLAQMQDVYNGYTNEELSEEIILNVYKLKTGRYTFSVPFAVGTMLANEDEKITEKLKKIGENLGILFQLKDDELGVLGNVEITGKSIGGDIKENKKTIIKQILYKKISKEEKNKLQQIYGNKNASTEDIHIVVELINKYKTIKETQSIWEKYENITSQESENLDGSLKSAIFSLISYNKNRTK